MLIFPLHSSPDTARFPVPLIATPNPLPYFPRNSNPSVPSNTEVFVPAWPVQESALVAFYRYEYSPTWLNAPIKSVTDSGDSPGFSIIIDTKQTGKVFVYYTSFDATSNTAAVARIISCTHQFFIGCIVSASPLCLQSRR